MFLFARLGGEVCQHLPHKYHPWGVPGAGRTPAGPVARDTVPLQPQVHVIPPHPTNTNACALAGAFAQTPAELCGCKPGPTRLWGCPG